MSQTSPLPDGRSQAAEKPFASVWAALVAPPASSPALLILLCTSQLRNTSWHHSRPGRSQQAVCVYGSKQFCEWKPCVRTRCSATSLERSKRMLLQVQPGNICPPQVALNRQRLESRPAKFVCNLLECVMASGSH